MKAHTTVIEGVPWGIDALCDYVLARYPDIVARLGDGGTVCVEGFGGLR